MTESDDDADASVHDPKVTGAPDDIWLIYGDIERDSTHAECYASGEVGWCDEAQFAADVRYTRTDLVAERVRAAVAAEREQWRAAAEYAAHQLEQARIWNGMEWHYNPLHPMHYRSALDRLRDALRLNRGVNPAAVRRSGVAKRSVGSATG